MENGSDEALGGFLLMLRARGFRDTALLTAIERAPRNTFLPLPYVGFAYQDMAIPLECGQEATPPLAVIEAVNALQVQPSHHVLEIGTGSGWQTAVLAGLCQAIVSIERFRTLAEDADRRLQHLGFTSAVVAHGDGEGGMPAAAPFDRIIINAAVEEISPLLIAQLAPGGQIISPVIGEKGQRLMRIALRDDQTVAADLGACRFGMLTPGTANEL
jgi:protein-L-isoaspartate(D-aspartate) O-methyltransferase